MNIIARKFISSVVCSLLFFLLFNNNGNFLILFYFYLVLPLSLIYGGSISYFAEKLTNNNPLYTFCLCWLGALATPLFLLILSGKIKVLFIIGIYGGYSIYLTSLIFSFVYWLVDRLLFLYRPDK
ncbi:hypothetical protein [Marininema halotolerans]|uniref:4 TMS phage holin, superfamily IV n=1 Tax=Marininema halotolerans TaxID=1155944 RepID=A0A1I6Q4F4_9BACL|nr:hypothetical protein [Marininema halotolerans]SFS47327.1 hypothetical protein SAMN05444972_102335 [Marininema halotolerans]